MNVQELIDLLQQVDKTLIVRSEGCDCNGNAYGIEVDEYAVLISRKEHGLKKWTKK